MKIVVYNLGCKVNQYESDGIIHELTELGYSVSSELEFAQAYILNTCAVTNEAERKSRQAVARCRKLNDNATIIVCGCASENDSKQFESKDGVSYISGVANKAKIPKILKEKGVFVEQLPKVYEDNLTPLAMRTRSYVKIQDGCNNFCSYCLIPYVRGRSRSRAVTSVVEECKNLAEYAKEIVLTGINLSAYGKDIASSLTDILLALSEVDTRIRLGSLEVNIIDEEFLKSTQKLKNFCPHFHLSLQSGDDSTLKNMNRKYTTQEYYSKVQLIRSFYPLAGITTDLICGYPIETDAEFENTLKFIDTVEFSDMHIFAYSSRNGTVAGKLKPLDKNIVNARCMQAQNIADRNKKKFLAKFIGKKVEVLMEDNCGYSKEYIRVYVDNASQNQIIETVPKDFYLDGLK